MKNSQNRRQKPAEVQTTETLKHSGGGRQGITIQKEKTKEHEEPISVFLPLRYL